MRTLPHHLSKTTAAFCLIASVSGIVSSFALPMLQRKVRLMVPCLLVALALGQINVDIAVCPVFLAC